MTKAEARREAFQVIDDDCELIDVYQRKGIWYVLFIDYRGWECRKRIF